MTLDEIKKLNLRYSFRAMMLWEQAMDRPFALDGQFTTTILFLWCVLYSSNPGMDLTYDKFMDSLDADPSILEYLSGWLKREVEARNTIAGKDKKSKKKATPSK